MRTRNAERRVANTRASGRGAVPAGTARLSAFHGGSRWAVVIPQLSCRPGFLGRGGRTIPLTAFRRRPCVSRRLCAHPRRGDVGDDLWRRRALGHKRRHGRQVGTIAGLSRRRKCHPIRISASTRSPITRSATACSAISLRCPPRAACCHAVINPENCVVEMERVIAEARRNNQPAYIAVPSDYALIPGRVGRRETDRATIERSCVTKGDGDDRRACQQSKIRRRVSGLHGFAARLAKAGTEGDRSVGLSFCHDAHGKMHDRRGSSAVCRHVCRRGVGAENAANRRRRRYRPRSGRCQFERHHHGRLFRPPRSVPVYYRRPRRRQDRRRS